MIELFSKDIYVNQRQSSKGNQLKWESDNVWYKADYAGYEGLAEYVVSHLLKLSNLREDEFVLYNLESISYNEQIYYGCKSNSFLKDRERLITLERLFKEKYGTSFYQSVFKIEGIKERLEFIVDSVFKITGLKDFDRYFAKLITIDALFLNEDRHMHNIALIQDSDNNFRVCPIFDNGACLLSDTTMDYPLSNDTYKLMSKVKPKTFAFDFLEQLEEVEKMCGDTIRFKWSSNDVIGILNKDNNYNNDIKTRVYEILMSQRSKYGYLFK